jgi:transcriptional regulator with XRE-family HTH domain
MKNAMLERIRGIRASKAKSVNVFARLIGMSQTTVNGIMLGSRGVSVDIIVAILTAFPDISAEWLMRGEGEMLRSEEVAQNALISEETIAHYTSVIKSYEILLANRDEQIRKLELELIQVKGVI